MTPASAPIHRTQARPLHGWHPARPVRGVPVGLTPTEPSAPVAPAPALLLTPADRGRAVVIDALRWSHAEALAERNRLARRCDTRGLRQADRRLRDLTTLILAEEAGL